MAKLNVENIPGVKNVMVSQEYAACETVNENISELITSTGSFKNDTQYKGEGMLIAVVDNGLDYTHSAFQTMPEEENLTQAELETLLSSLWGKTAKNKDFTIDQIYKSKKFLISLTILHVMQM
jgi:Subtilase family.